MAIKIFYSWQSDTAANSNRNFIEDALKKAIKSLDTDVELQEAIRDETIELDKDTKGVPGTPPIADVIFEKISKCSVFVPDLTFVAQTRGGRYVPNPNVLIEYGWALSKLGHSRMVPVMNVAIGKADNTTLPFDMKHLRHPLTYQLDEATSPEEKARVKDTLTKELAEAIALILRNVAPTDPGDKAAQFKRVPATFNSGTYLSPDEALAKQEMGSDADKLVQISSGAKLFLRLIPTQPMSPISTSKAALDLIRAGTLAPMGTSNSGSYLLRNRFGAVILNLQNGKFISSSQLFLNGEIWGIEAYGLDKEHQKNFAGVSFGYFPCAWLEDCFVATLGRYIQFARYTLNAELPLTFIAGVTGVEDYRMTAPKGMYLAEGQFGGRSIKDEIVFEGTVPNYDVDLRQVLRPFFERIWEECGLDRPPRENLG
jgi:hypothetical protein